MLGPPTYNHSTGLIFAGRFLRINSNASATPTITATYFSFSFRCATSVAVMERKGTSPRWKMVIISLPFPLARDPALGPFRIGISRNSISLSWYFSRSSFVRGKRGIRMRTKIALAPLSTREYKSIGKECLWDLREIMGLEDREATWLVEQEGIN